MAQKRVEYFECTCCGAREPQETVSYDRFGYAVCPTCGYSRRPDDVC